MRDNTDFLGEMTTIAKRVIRADQYKYDPAKGGEVYVVHVAGEALEAVTGQRHSYTNPKASHEALEKILADAGQHIPASSMFGVGYDDVSFEVPSQATGKIVVDKLNQILPRSTGEGGYGYGTSFAAQVVAYNNLKDQPNFREGDEYSSPAEWAYPPSDL